MGRSTHPGTGRLLLIYGALSLAAVLLGAVVAANHGVPTGSWVRNILAWAVGAGLAAAIAGGFRSGALPFILGLVPAGLLMTLFSAPQEGVHRWVDPGPFHVNVAMLVLPAALVAAAGLMVRQTGLVLGVLMLSVGVMVVQPDASQATTLALGGIWIVTLAVQKRWLKVGASLAFVLMAVLCWFRPDTLLPIAEVEEIIVLAFGQSPVLAVLILLLLAGIAVAPAALSGASRSSAPTVWWAGGALGLCFAGWAVAPFLGAFPVPFAGIGMSPILGGWLGIGLLAGLARSGPQTQAPVPDGTRQETAQ